ncbi:hypothetical protein HMPREF0044_0005 [Gleimia coleocanis DSM 15436]|uniref:Uncharacterized protein n=1 Tax=Gleimia coleocanis DSM 15436 TaxID=525245 RepID=C0VXW5_9ACTO|nr:hypothetical protein [Gleimia coleocanis]EEH64268.1 hypothetical protein HMPREF0044_0005 [Gleimia coleocanis DSM 15436]
MRKSPVYRIYRITLATWVSLTLITTGFTKLFPATATIIFGQQIWWLTIHIFTLGVITSSILVWIWHFAITLLRYSNFQSQQPTYRLLTHNTGTLLLVASFTLGNIYLLIAGYALIIASFTWLLGSLLHAIHTASFQSPLSGVVRYYALATAILLTGITLGLFLGLENLNAISLKNRDALLLTHVAANIISFVGITIFTTLGTLLPTTSRTKVIPQARAVLTHGFLPTIFGVTTLLAGTFYLNKHLLIAGTLILTSLFLTLTIVAVLPLKQGAHWGYPTQTLLFGAFWLVAGAIGLTYLAIFNNPFQLRLEITSLLPLLMVGVAQILLGSLAYLLPMIIGLGPALKDTYRKLDQHTELRVLFPNLNLAFSFFLPSYTAAWELGWVFLLGNLLFLNYLVLRQLRSRPAEFTPVPTPENRPNLLANGK